MKQTTAAGNKNLLHFVGTQLWFYELSDYADRH